MIEIEGFGIPGLYLFLKERDSELDKDLKKIVLKLEEHLYDRLSIDEMENIEKLYREKSSALISRL